MTLPCTTSLRQSLVQFLSGAGEDRARRASPFVQPILRLQQQHPRVAVSHLICIRINAGVRKHARPSVPTITHPYHPVWQERRRNDLRGVVLL
eukprot:gene5775-biopygen7814